MLPNEITNHWWSWWSFLNTPTRVASSNHQLVPGADGAGIEIVKLWAPGKCGWLGLLYSLMVWREWVGDGDTSDASAGLLIDSVR
jgi:hypothetical protein